MNESRVSVIEYTDPGCPWSWASEPTLRWVRRRYANHVDWRRVLGVQIDNLAKAFPDLDAVTDVETFRGVWLEISGHSGSPVTERLEWMHGSTRPACTAVKAAGLQGEDVAARALRRLREAVFVLGRPADTPERIRAVLDGTPGLDADKLLQDMDSDEVRSAVQADFLETRDPRPEVVGLTEPLPNPGAARQDGDAVRYSFPTLILLGPDGERVVAGWRTPEAYEEAFEVVDHQFRALPVDEPLTPSEALDRYRSLTTRDLELLTGQSDAPAEAVRLDTATSSLWLHPEEAASRDLSALLLL